MSSSRSIAGVETIKQQQIRAVWRPKSVGAGFAYGLVHSSWPNQIHQLMVLIQSNPVVHNWHPIQFNPIQSKNSLY